jgi:hypothetical protein
MPVVVVDNASEDGTRDLVRSAYPTARLVARARNGGFAVAVNEGLRVCGDDDVLVLNPDVVVAPGSVDILENYMRDHPTVGIAVPRLVYPDGTTQLSVRTFPSPITMLARRSVFGTTHLGRKLLSRHLEEGAVDVSRAVDWALGAALLVRRQAIADVGAMDRRFFLYGEDVDWCYRMWAGGWQVHVVPEAVMEHRYERASRGTLDLRSAPTRHHWASVFKLFALHPGLLIGRGPRLAREASVRRD